MSPPVVSCNRCGSTQLSANRRGFGGGSALVGGLLLGPLGLLGGFAGAGKITISCLSCGNQWRAGEQPAKATGFGTLVCVAVLGFLALGIFSVAVNKRAEPSYVAATTAKAAPATIAPTAKAASARRTAPTAKPDAGPIDRVEHFAAAGGWQK